MKRVCLLTLLFICFSFVWTYAAPNNASPEIKTSGGKTVYGLSIWDNENYGQAKSWLSFPLDDVGLPTSKIFALDDNVWA